MEFLELMTNYQINITLLALLIVAVLISGLFFYYTNDVKTTLITFLSVIFVPILTGIFLLILYKFFKIEPSEKHTLILWCSLIINTTNLSLLIGKYATEVIKKGFDIDYVTRHHFSATLNLFMTILLITFSVGIFVKSDMLIVLLGIFLVSSLTIWFNHLIARLLLKEK